MSRRLNPSQYRVNANINRYSPPEDSQLQGCKGGNENVRFRRNLQSEDDIEIIPFDEYITGTTKAAPHVTTVRCFVHLLGTGRQHNPLR